MYSCKEVTEIVCAEEYSRLSFSGKMNYKFHMIICHTCREYLKIIEKVSAALTSLIKSRSQQPSIEEMENLKKEIIEKIRDQNHNST